MVFYKGMLIKALNFEAILFVVLPPLLVRASIHMHAMSPYFHLAA